MSTKRYFRPVYAEVCLPGSDEAVFVKWEIALADPTMRRQVVAAALRELKAFVEQYRSLDELKEFCAEAERLLKRKKPRNDA